MTRLADASTKNTKDWRDLAPLEGWCKVISVYDGDTCWVAIDLNNPGLNPNNSGLPGLNPGLPGLNPNIRKVNVRIARINAPEIKGGTEATREAARASRDFARELLLNKIVRFRFGNFGLIKGESLDSFHRQIGELEIAKPHNSNLYLGGSELINFSDIMLATGHAVVFT
jgi:endonuclease YncB( thermonuclease family)